MIYELLDCGDFFPHSEFISHLNRSNLIWSEMAEREGFEPSMGDKTHTPLAGERLQPLGHLSVAGKPSFYQQAVLIS